MEQRITSGAVRAAESIRSAAREPLQARAAFISLGTLALESRLDASASEYGPSTVAAALALAELYGEPELEVEIAHRLAVACGVLCNCYEKEGAAWLPFRIAENRREIGRTIFLLGPDLLEVTYSAIARFSVSPARPAAKVFTDGLAVLSSMRPVQPCPVCGRLYAGERATASYCSQRCQSAAGQRRARARRA